LVDSGTRIGANLIMAPTGTNDDEKVEIVKDADLILLFPCRLSNRVMKAAKQCKLIQLLSAGYDLMSLKMAIDLGIPMSNNDGANRAAVSEHTIMLILAVYCRLLYYANLARDGGWRLSEEWSIDGLEFWGETLGLVGMGNIAQKVVRRARRFDVNIQYYDRYASMTPAEVADMGVSRFP